MISKHIHLSDTIKENWKLYLCTLLFSVLIHLALFLKDGASPSSDYHVVYVPEATQIIGWLKGTNPFPAMPITQVFHLGYVFFITFIFLLFGTGNLTALIIAQIIISIPIYLLILHISLKNYSSKPVAVLFTMAAISFYDNIVWVVWGVPDSLYKVLLIISYFVLPPLYLQRRYGAFIIGLLISFVILVHIRIDTVFLFLPLIWFSRKFFIKTITTHKYASLIGAGIMVIGGLFLCEQIKGVFNTIKYFFIEGYVVLGTGQHILGITNIEPYNYSLQYDMFYNIARFGKLLSLRLFYFLNVFPPFWSLPHKIYHAVYMLFFYFFAVAGIIRVKKTNDGYFLMFFLTYLASMVIQALTFVDVEKRYIQSTLPFLIMFAGYGFDYLYRRYRKETPNG